MDIFLTSSVHAKPSIYLFKNIFREWLSVNEEDGLTSISMEDDVPWKSSKQLQGIQVTCSME